MDFFFSFGNLFVVPKSSCLFHHFGNKSVESINYLLRSGWIWIKLDICIVMS